MEDVFKITIYEPKTVIIPDDALKMAKELADKLNKDKILLEKNNTKENQSNFKKNEYMLYWLKFDYYNLLSISSRINEEEIKNGWFVWLKTYEVSINEQYSSIDQKNTIIYDRYFDFFMPNLYNVGPQINEAIVCYKNHNYFSCACTLFSSLEFIERSITAFDPKEKFVMSSQLKTIQTESVVSFNSYYYEKFERQMNTFLLKNFYAKSLQSDPEPKQINRNRIMHGIFTREVSKTDCLKLFVLLNSLLMLDDWLNCYRQMKEISSHLDKE